MNAKRICLLAEVCVANTQHRFIKRPFGVSWNPNLLLLIISSFFLSIQLHEANSVLAQTGV